MIESFESKEAKVIFEGRWDMLPTSAEPGALEECFLDLRILDASVSRADIETAFKNRIAGMAGRQNTNSFILAPPSTGAGFYEITFKWTGSAVVVLNIQLAKSAAA